jgi:hypothetical protein
VVKERPKVLRHLEATAVELRERIGAMHDVNRRAPLRARLGEIERPSLELERGLRELPCNRLPAFPPAQSSRDHEVNDDVQRVVRTDHDALAESTDGSYLLADDRCERRVDRLSTNGLSARAPDLLAESGSQRSM